MGGWRARHPSGVRCVRTILECPSRGIPRGPPRCESGRKSAYNTYIFGCLKAAGRRPSRGGPAPYRSAVQAKPTQDGRVGQGQQNQQSSGRPRSPHDRLRGISPGGRAPERPSSKGSERYPSRGSERPRSNTPSRGRFKCFICESLDHMFMECPEHICGSCKLKGHYYAQCPTGCHDCGQKGHSRRRCPKALCGECGQNGHTARDCPKVAAPSATRRAMCIGIARPHLWAAVRCRHPLSGATAPRGAGGHQVRRRREERMAGGT